MAKHRLRPESPLEYWSEDRKILITKVAAREGERLRRVYDIPTFRGRAIVDFFVTGFRVTLPLFILAVSLVVAWH